MIVLTTVPAEKKEEKKTTSVAEFLKGVVKKYVCGYQARKEEKTKKTLKQAFVASSFAERRDETELFGEAIDDIMKTPTGRETMTALSGLGYSFHFDTARDCAGFCMPGQKKIVINPEFGFGCMLETIVHEGTHAIQKSLEKRNAPDYPDMKIADMLRCRRAIEADAVAHEMAFVYECKDVLPSVYKNAQERGLPMFDAYVDEMEYSGDEKKAMRSAFFAWYECKEYLDGYDKNYKRDARRWSEWAMDQDYDACFTKDYSAKDVLKMCRYKGKQYMTTDCFLNEGMAFSVSAEDKKEFADMTRHYAGAVGAKVDTSVMSMRSRSASGRLLPENNTVNAAFASKAKQSGR